jgi:hypothetical protein
MSNEKVRLLLLVKDEILNYIQKQFENDAFIGLLQGKKELQLRSNMEHMVADYFLAIEYLTEGKSSLEAKELRLVSFLQRTIHRHIKSMSYLDLNRSGIRENYTQVQLENLFHDILDLPGLARISIPPEERHLTIRVDDNFTCHPVIIDQIFPELVINMWRNSIELEVKGDEALTHHFTIEATSEHILFINDYNPSINTDPDTVKPNGGKQMCKELAKELHMEFLVRIEKDNKFHAKIVFTP